MRLAHKKAKQEDYQSQVMFELLMNKLDELIDEIKQDRNERNKDK